MGGVSDAAHDVLSLSVQFVVVVTFIFVVVVSRSVTVESVVYFLGFVIAFLGEFGPLSVVVFSVVVFSVVVFSVVVFSVVVFSVVVFSVVVFSVVGQFQYIKRFPKQQFIEQ